MRYLKQNTDQYVTVGPLIDKTDGLTTKDDATVTNLTYLMSIPTHSGASTHVTGTCSATAANDYGCAAIGHNGMYDLKLADADLNFVGSLTLCITYPTAYLPVWHEFMVVPANVWDSMMGTDLLDTNNSQWLGETIHAATVNGVPVVQLHNSAGTGGINAPANFEDMSITDTTGLVALAATQKVDVETIKTQSVTCSAGVTVLASVGAPAAPGASGGLPTTNGTKLNQTADLTAGQSIACSDKTGFSLASTGADLILKSSTFIQAIVAAVNEFATYGLTALNTLLVSTGIKAATVPAVTLANGAHGGASATITLQTPIAATVPDNQKVDLNTIKAQTVTCAAGVTINVNTGTTQPVNFTGTGASALVKTDTIDHAGTAQTAGDIIPAISGIGTAGGAAINQDTATDNYGGGITGVTSGTTKVGTETGTYANTSNVNSVYQIMTHAAQVVDIVYQFLTGGGTQPVSCVWTGYYQPVNGVLTFSAWNHVAGAWEVLTTQAGSSGTTNVIKNITLYPRHSGTSAAELGKVYIRLNSATAHNHVIGTDQIIVSYAVTSRTVGYANGAVWLDTNLGSAGTVSYVNGTADKPANSIANALTIAGNVGLKRIQVAPGTSFTLAASAAGYEFLGEAWTVALGNQNIAGAIFHHATVSGVSSGTGAEFYNCDIEEATIAEADFNDCAFDDELTTITGGNYLIKDCVDGIPGSGNPLFTLTANTTLGIRNWAGGLNIGAMDSTNVIMIDGRGKLIINDGCSGGEFRVRGNFDVQDLVSGGFAGTLSQTANVNTTTINAQVVDGLSVDTYAEPGQGAPPATTSIANKVGYAYKAWRNLHTQTATEYALYADNTTTKDQKAAVSDDATTFTRGEIGTGA